jgi:hypothetical protein
VSLRHLPNKHYRFSQLDGSVSTVTRQRVEDPENSGSIPESGGDFSLRNCDNIGSRADAASYQISIGAHSPG